MGQARTLEALHDDALPRLERRAAAMLADAGIVLTAAELTRSR